MRFTKAQVALFQSGINFVYMGLNEVKVREAISDFQDAIKAEGSWSRCLNEFKNDRIGNCAWFRACMVTGASSEHVAVLFMDVKREDVRDKRAYDEAKYIPAPRDGCGPMVIR
jgi:hypothetical protein